MEDRRHIAVVFHHALAAAGADAVVFAGGFDDETRFFDRERQRFFAVNVFARHTGFDRDLRVPVVRRRADDHVDVVAVGEQVFVTMEFGDGVVFIMVVDATGGAVDAFFPAVANRDDLVVRVVQETAEQLAPAVPDPDESRRQFVARGDAAVITEDGARQEERSGNRARRRRQKLAAIKFRLLVFHRPNLCRCSGWD